MNNPVNTLTPKSEIPVGTSGGWEVERFEVSPSTAMISAIRDPKRACPAGTYTKIKQGGSLWMSDTPAEMMDHEMPVRRASGHVLITGLGLGMAAIDAVSALEEVAQVATC